MMLVLKNSILAASDKTILMSDSYQQKSYCAVGLCNPKSPSNVGSVIRACGCFGADDIFYTGTRYDRAEPFYTDTGNQRNTIALQRVDDLILTAAKELQTVCIELCENATPLADFTHPDQAMYLFGPEDHSLPQSTIDAADHVVFIPTKGCLNLSASVNIVLYDRTMKRSAGLDKNQSNDLVRNSRDCKNKLKVRPEQ